MRREEREIGVSKGKQMNRKQMIHDVLDLKPQERLPRAVFGGGLWIFHSLCLLPARISIEPKRFIREIAHRYSEWDTDMLFLGSGLNSFPAEAVGGKIKFRGELAPLLEQPVIRSPKDIERIGEIDFSNCANVNALLQVVRGVTEQFPDRFICVTGCGPFTWAMLLCDGDLLKRKLQDDPVFIREVCDLGVRLSSAFVDAVANAAPRVDAISVPDGSVTLISDEQYRDLVFPAQKKLFDHIRRKKLRRILHMCGETRTKLNLFHRTGAECVTVDNHVTMKETYDLFGGKTVAAGNVDVVNVVGKGTEDEIRQEVKKCVGQVGDPKKGFILMPSCDLPLETPAKNVKAFLTVADSV